jgi:HAD superfamily hydrolase (TIGR01549 family)
MFDSTAANRAYYDHLLRHFGKPPMTASQFAFAHMHTVDESLAHLFGTGPELEQVHRYRKQMSYLPFIKYMQMEPYLVPLLTHLRTRYKTAIATNRTDTMDRVLHEHDLGHLFDLVITARDVVHPKPQPDPLLKVLAHFEVEAHHVLYVGDSELDAQAAHAAGIPLAAYKNPLLQAELHIQHFRELASLLG